MELQQPITTRQFREHVIQKRAVSDLSVLKEVYNYRPTATENVMDFVFSSKVVDLNGDRVFPHGIDFKNYIERNPLVLTHHDAHSYPIGKTIALGVVNDELVGTIEFFTDLDEADIGTNARAAVGLIKRGTMGLSITFIPRAFELNTTDGVDFHRCLLLETSVVSLPCCPESFRITAPDSLQASVPDTLFVVRARKAAARRRAIAMAE